jgi:hypothetical protein
MVIDSGLHQRLAFGAPNRNLVYRHASTLKPRDLFFYDVIFVTFHVDQISLLRLRDGFISFLNKSGVLVILGATDYSNLGWLPYCTWNDEYLYNCTISTPPSQQETVLFNNITSERLRLHTSYCGHGSVIPTQLDKCDLLIVAENNRVLMFCKTFDTGGTLLVTTLDPDYHCVRGVQDTTSEESRDAQHYARVLLNNVLDWSIIVSKRNSRIRRLGIGLSKTLLFWLGAIFAFSIPGLIGFFISKMSGSWPSDWKTQVVAIITASAVVASIINYWRIIWHWRKNKNN